MIDVKRIEHAAGIVCRARRGDRIQRHAIAAVFGILQPAVDVALTGVIGADDLFCIAVKASGQIAQIPCAEAAF